MSINLKKKTLIAKNMCPNFIVKLNNCLMLKILALISWMQTAVIVLHVMNNVKILNSFNELLLGINFEL